MKKYHVYGIGNALVDTEFEVTDQFLSKAGIQKGLMTLIDETTHEQLITQLSNNELPKKRASGGSGANTITAISQFGGSSFYSYRVANDEAGTFYTQDLQASGVQIVNNTERPDGITGKCLVMVTNDAERTMNTFLGATAEFSETELAESALVESEYLYIEGYLVASETALAAAIKAKAVADQHHIKTAISLSDPSMIEFFKSQMQQVIGNGVDLLFCNRDEAKLWSGSESMDDAIESLKQVAKHFVITLGAEGALVFDGTQLYQVDAISTQAVDTNGAGDMFAGAYLYALSQNIKPESAAKFANIAAAKVVSQFGPRLSQNAIDELKKQILA